MYQCQYQQSWELRFLTEQSVFLKYKLMLGAFADTLLLCYQCSYDFLMLVYPSYSMQRPLTEATKNSTLIFQRFYPR